MSRVQGYEFQVRTGDQSEWTQIQGNGGAIGNGCIFEGGVTGPELEAHLLATAQRKLRRNGSLIRLTGIEFPIDARQQTFSPDAVTACRALETHR